MRAHVSSHAAQELRSHVVIHLNHRQGIIMLSKILVYLALISRATVGLPLCFDILVLF